MPDLCVQGDRHTENEWRRLRLCRYNAAYQRLQCGRLRQVYQGGTQNEKEAGKEQRERK